MPRFTKRYQLAVLLVLLGLGTLLAVVLIGRWLNATKRGGQGPAEPFRIAGNLYYVGATVASTAAKDPVEPFIDPAGYHAYIDAAEAELRSGRLH